ncbi:MAG: hypothetical protein JWQ90_3512 [Hydrocarboniphaga sp.]|uniref:TonB-dependent receptor n=1 Tax=Hydrocarboniphaga sp. TaxID=2033016 RepID=UPI00260C2CE2|nr:TonB-dependent receptor [Hydrocarboniphaga sp.]MDB5971062.1 hypothetical protein [Hydrocarboniphaga sp.]
MSKGMKPVWPLAASFAALSAVTAPVAGWAQQEAPVQPAQTSVEAAPEPVPAQLEEIIVTATRREQSLSKVPIAVTEVSAEQLDSAVVRDTQSLQMQVPSLAVTVSGSESAGAVIRIRGVGTSGGNAGFESSVGTFIDGVYIPRAGLALNDLVDIDRIEVLRGPQGTLFGKNTSVGAINVYTKQPTFEPEAELSGSVGSYENIIARGSVSGGVTDKLALRLAGQYNVRDGYIQNQTDDRRYNDRDRFVLRGQALYQFTPDVSLRLIADHFRKDERCCVAPYTLNGAIPSGVIAGLGGTVFDPPQDYTTAFDAEVGSEAEDSGISGHLSWNLGWAELKTILAYRDGNAHDVSDADYSDLAIAYIPYQDSTLRSRTAEISLNGEAGRLNWLAGAFYSKEDVSLNSSTLFGADAGAYLQALVRATSSSQIPRSFYPSGTGQVTHAEQDGDSFSLFTHNVVDLGAGFDLSAGLRWLHETKDGGGESTTTAPTCANAALPASLKLLCGAAPYEDHYDDNRLTGTAALGKSFGTGRYVYASYSAGFKSGGINLNPPSTTGGTTSFDPEKVKSYELGLRLRLGNRIATRTTLFYMDIKDFQLLSFDGVTSTVSNAAAVISKGVEFESDWLALDTLMLRGSLTYADAKYGKQTDSDTLRGEQLTNAPRWTGQLGANYERPLSWADTRLLGNVVARYQSKLNTGSDLDPSKEQGAYTLVNARLGLRFVSGYEASLWGANLLDEYYRQIVFNSVAQTGSYNGYVGLPRTWGVEVKKRF